MIAVALAGLAFQAQPIDYREETLGQFRPTVVLQIEPSLRLNGEVLSVYAPFTGPRSNAVRYLAIRRVITGYRAPPTDEWIVVSECTGAEAALLDLEALSPPSIDIPTIGRDDRQGPPLDGVGYKLFVRSPTWSDAFAYEMEFSTNIDTPLAAWATRFRSVLEPCWTRTRPTAWGDATGRDDQ